MITKSTFLFRWGLICLAAWLAGGLLWGAGNNYVAIFSAEQESHRRILLDGVGNRRVEVELNNLGQVEVKVWGVGEQTYVGRRVYDSGYFIPVTIRVEFPRKNLMSTPRELFPRRNHFRPLACGAIPAGHSSGSPTARIEPICNIAAADCSPDPGKGNGPIQENHPASGGLGRVCFRIAADHRPGPGVVHTAAKFNNCEVCLIPAGTCRRGKPTHYLRCTGTGVYGA